MNAGLYKASFDNIYCCYFLFGESGISFNAGASGQKKAKEEKLEDGQNKTKPQYVGNLSIITSRKMCLFQSRTFQSLSFKCYCKQVRIQPRFA